MRDLQLYANICLKEVEEAGIKHGNINKVSECEKQCARYHRCDNVAMADDILKEYEERKLSLEEENGINENISYGIFVLGYDLLQKKLNKLDFPCDVAYEKCKKIYNSFLSSKEYFLDKSEYECLQDYLEENKELVNAVLYNKLYIGEE